MILVLLLACGDHPLTGSAAKGPLILGSSVDVAALDDDAEPTGTIWSTETTSDLGVFSLANVESGPARIEATGYAFDEVRGTLTTSPITLRAIGEIGSAATLQVNTVTHLAAGRIATLMADGSSVEDATVQAEAELISALGFSPSGFDPGATGVEMSLLGGDTDGDAWLLAVSAVLAQAAVDEAGDDSVDATLQELLNSLASDLADDGALAAGHTTVLATAVDALDSDAVINLLGGRFDDLGFAGDVPDLRRALDRDGDGTSDDDDEDADGDGEPSVEFGGNDCHDEDASALGCGPLGEVVIDDVLDQRIIGAQTDSSFGQPLLAMGDLDADGKVDFALGTGDELRFYTAGDAATPAAPVATVSTRWTWAAVAGDTDGDGTSEVLLANGNWGVYGAQVLVVDYPPATSDPEALGAPVLSAESTESYLGQPAGLGDLNDDGYDDLGAAERPATSSCESCGAFWIFEGPIAASTTTADAAASLWGDQPDGAFVTNHRGDLDGDGTPDLLVGDFLASNGSTEYTGAIYLFSSGVSGAMDVADADAVALGTQWGNYITLLHTDDLDGDGTSDIVARATNASGGADDPWVYLWSGPLIGTATLDTTSAVLVVDTYASMELNSSAGPSDADGDGQADLWVGARTDHTGSDAGSAYLFYGPISGSLDFASSDARISGSVETEYVGLRLAAPGDLDGDGHEDLLLYRQPGYVPEVDIVLGGASW